MYPILFEHDVTSWDTFGIGVLSDAITCEVEENRNGSYELEMTYPITGAFFSEIKLRRLIVAKPNYTDNPQPFRIYSISKPLNGMITVNAQHISYDLSGYVDAPFTAADSQLAISKLTDSTIIFPSSCPFSFSSNIHSSSGFSLKHPASIRSLMGGMRGSLVDVYGGEWHFDRFACQLYSARGENRGVTIRYGKNLTDLNQEENNTKVYTAVYPYYYNDDANVLVTLPERAINVPGTFSYTKVLNLDLSNDFEETPTVADLRSKAEQYIDQNDIGKPVVNLTVSFLEDVGVIERVDLCDTVSVYFEKLGVTATAKCIRTKWDVLKDRYIEAELGSARNSLAEDIANSSEIANAIDERTSQFKRIAAGIVGKVTGNSGGYIVLHDTNNDGEPDEILIMDSDDINTAVKIIRFNNAGIAFSKTGYNGTYSTAWNIDGEFVADFIASGELHTDMVKVLGDTQFYWDNNNITIISPSDQNKMIRFGKYDDVNYGLGFSNDGGVTWSSGFDFDGIRLTKTGTTSYAKLTGDSFEIRNASNETIAYIGHDTCVDLDGNNVIAPRYLLGTRKSGTVTGIYSFAGGQLTDVSGPYSVAVGYSATSKKEYGLALGYCAVTEETNSVAIGSEADALDISSVSLGHSASTNAEYAIAIGFSSLAYIGSRAIAIGADALSSGALGVALGGNSISQGVSSVAIGYAVATKQYAIAIGNDSSAKAKGAIAIGDSRAESGEYAVALGGGTASGKRSFAIGEGAMALGDYSVAIGNDAVADEANSIAIGSGVEAYRKDSFVCGKYNVTGNWIFVIGNGTNALNPSNALRMENSGNMWIAGTLTQGSDRRAKDILDADMPDVSQIKAVRYKWNDTLINHDEGEHIGYIAQDVEKVAPYLIETDETTGFKSLNYIEFLCAKIDQLERTVERLVKRVEELEGVTV